ncbi:MAG: hypothetical protein H7331_08125 [Bacteroidia bacterium]|nr:hypothetical protein [Bacteroidia bacterium]
MKNIVAVLIVLLTLKATSQAQNIGVNTLTPDGSAIMDISHSSRGLLIPRLPLTSTTDVTTIVSPALSLLVFNTATAGVSPNDVTPGYYYWNSIKWVGISGDSWRLTGNAGTTAGTNFVGTIDNQDLVFKTNSIENMRILNTNGNVGIGTTTPALKLHLHDGAQNFHAIRLTSGISQANYWDIVKRGDAYGVGQNHNFAFAYNLIELVTISPTGNVGIAVNTPSQKLDIAGSIKITDGTEGISKVLTSDATGKGTWTIPASDNTASDVQLPILAGSNVPALYTNYTTLSKGVYMVYFYNCLTATAPDYYLYVVAQASTGTITSTSSVWQPSQNRSYTTTPFVVKVQSVTASVRGAVIHGSGGTVSDPAPPTSCTSFNFVRIGD